MTHQLTEKEFHNICMALNLWYGDLHYYSNEYDDEEYANELRIKYLEELTTIKNKIEGLVK